VYTQWKMENRYRDKGGDEACGILRDAAMYRCAGGLRGDLSAARTFLCRVASRVMVFKEDDRFFCRYSTFSSSLFRVLCIPRGRIRKLKDGTRLWSWQSEMVAGYGKGYHRIRDCIERLAVSSTWRLIIQDRKVQRRLIKHTICLRIDETETFSYLGEETLEMPKKARLSVEGSTRLNHRDVARRE